MGMAAVGLAEASAEAGDFEAAARHFREAIALEPECALHRDALAQCLLELGEPEAAAAEASAASMLAPGWTAPLLTLGRASLNAGRFADAVLSLRVVLAAVVPPACETSAGVLPSPDTSGSPPLLDAAEVEELRHDLVRAEQLLLQVLGHEHAHRPAGAPDHPSLAPASVAGG
jgi:predicted Zn-dependent protease